MSQAQIIITSCSRRSLEIEQVKDFLRGNGYSVIDDDWNVAPSADIILLSTCGFTQAAEAFGFETLHRVQEAKKPGAKIIFGGCIPEINPERVSREFGGPTFSPQCYSKLSDILETQHSFEEFKRPNTYAGSLTSTLIGDMQSAIGIFKTFDGSFSGLRYIYQRLSNGARRRLIQTRYANLFDQQTFYIQIQEGCSMHCSYCVIHKAIGPLRSKPIETVLDEFQTGLDNGFRHFHLVGDNAGSYGLDVGLNMGHLLERIAALEGDFDLDLTDINPVYLPMILDQLRDLCVQQRLARLYIPIQSASRRVLKLMNRDGDMNAVKQMLVEVRKLAPRRFKLGTSLIVGFPSETIQELDETIEFCSQVGFDWVWCHSFSARPETPAAALADQIPDEEILRRANLVRSRLAGTALVTTAADTAGSRTCQG